MSFNNILYKLLLGMLFLTFNAQFYKSIVLPTDVAYLLAVIFLYSVAIMMHEQLLNFLTIRKVFITRLIVIALLVGITIYIMDLIVPGFKIESTALSSKTLGVIAIQAKSISKYGTMALIALMTGLLGAVFETLRKPSA